MQAVCSSFATITSVKSHGGHRVNQSVQRPKPTVLLILDGWGYREEVEDNALAQADLPNWRRLWDDYPRALIHTEGRYVGLPDGQMGNSEVGHMNLGAGRIVYQDLTRIDAAIEDGSFFKNEELVAACHVAKAAGRTLHVMGLLSPGGVHSHENHIIAMLELAAFLKVPSVAAHVFLDGRDTPPRSAQPSLQLLQKKCADLGNATIATVSGRYYAMDRDKRWDRVRLAWDAIVDAKSEYHADTAVAALNDAYARGEDDEFVLPTVIADGKAMQDGDAVVFMNFRADRARQLSAAFVSPVFDGFFSARKPELSKFVTLTEYDALLPVSVAFASEDLHDTLGEVVAAHGMSQLRIAETEKYAHVTFFFSGGRELEFEGEQRSLIPSPKVATYDLQPEMSCPELTATLVDAIEQNAFDLIICNIANPDMVGHSGDLQAAIKAAEAVDQAIGAISAAVIDKHGAMIITADHGNLEMMRDPVTGQPHTAHTVGPVPLIYIGTRRHAQLKTDGALRDVAPTLLDILNIDKPAAMTGQSLLS